jgi:hypothetical protein
LSYRRVNIDAPDDELRRHLKEAIEEQGVSLNEIAKKTKIPYASLWRWYNKPNQVLRFEYRKRLVEWINDFLLKSHLGDAQSRMQEARFLTTTNTFADASRMFRDSPTAICIMERNICKGVLTIRRFEELEKSGRVRSDEDFFPIKNFMDVLEQYVKISLEARNDLIDSLLTVKSNRVLLVEDGEKLAGVIERSESKTGATKYRRVELNEFGKVYAQVELPRDAADVLIDMLQDHGGIHEGMRGLEVGTGPLNFLRQLYRRFRSKNIHFVTAEHQSELEWKIIAEEEVKKLGVEKLVDLRFEGLEDLTKYGSNFDCVVWSVTAPTEKGLDQLPRLLTDRGMVAISCYHRDALEVIYGIFDSALASEGKVFRRAKEIYGIDELADIVSVRGIKIQEGKFLTLDGHFKDPLHLLNFLSSSIADVGDIFFAYPGVRKRVEENVLGKIKELYGLHDITVPFKISFLLGIRS